MSTDPLSKLSGFPLSPEQALRFLPLLRSLESTEHPLPPTLMSVYVQIGSPVLQAAHESLPDQSVIISWSTKTAYAEIQVHQSGMYEWFLRDRELDTHAGSTGETSGLLPESFLTFVQSRFTT